MISFQKIAEERILQAQRQGAFDNLSGAGKPLRLEDDSNIPEDMRMVCKILKNADCLPPEVEIRKEIKQVEELLSAMPSTEKKYRKIKKLNYLVMKLNEIRNVSPMFEDHQYYEKKIVERLTTRKHTVR
ncbi:MAG: DnaJ family domain-containing protein [Desulfobacteria bacterium]